MRSSVLFLLGILAAVGQGGLAAEMPDTSKMNILFINIEDCYAGVWGCYGNPICKTPNIDRFARTAVRFDSAYCQAVSCNPSRTSFLSGLRPMSTHVFSNGDVMNEHLPAGTVTLPEMFKTKGFTTADIGKLFHRIDYAEKQMASFDRIEFYEKPEGWKGPGPILGFTPPPQRGPAVKNLTAKEKRQRQQQNSDRYGDSGLAPEQERDYQMASTAAALLEEFSKSKKPFFLAVSQSRPHTPLIAPKKYIDMYDPAKIPTPAAAPDTFVNMPGHYVKRAHGNNPDIFMQHQPTPEQARAAIAAYYACVSFVDDNVGRILHTLDQTGLARNTVVIFLGDHGFHLGDHGFWSKYSMLEPTRKVALIVRVPVAPANGRVCREFVEFVDLVPTLGALVQPGRPGTSRGQARRCWSTPSAPGRKPSSWLAAAVIPARSSAPGGTATWSIKTARSQRSSTWRRIPGRRTTSPTIRRMPKPVGKWRACSRRGGRRPCRRGSSPSTAARTTGNLAVERLTLGLPGYVSQGRLLPPPAHRALEC